MTIKKTELTLDPLAFTVHLPGFEFLVTTVEGMDLANHASHLHQRKHQEGRGEVVPLSGNTRALARSVRYIDKDLNRHWTPEIISAVKSAIKSESHFASAKSEDLELRELLEQFEQASERTHGEVYFLICIRPRRTESPSPLSATRFAIANSP